MRLLFDENISHKIIEKITSAFPEAKHVRQLQLEQKTDKQIFEYARKNNYCIVTFDEDFNNLSLLYGYPPKIIWLRSGNASTSSLILLLLSKEKVIKNFLESNEQESFYGCLEIY